MKVWTFGTGSATPPKSTWTPEAWDAHVRGHEHATYLQTSAWARVKALTGWAAVLVGDEAGEVGGAVGELALEGALGDFPVEAHEVRGTGVRTEDREV